MQSMHSTLRGHRGGNLNAYLRVTSRWRSCSFVVPMQVFRQYTNSGGLKGLLAWAEQNLTSVVSSDCAAMLCVVAQCLDFNCSTCCRIGRTRISSETQLPKVFEKRRRSGNTVVYLTVKQMSNSNKGKGGLPSIPVLGISFSTPEL